MQTDWSSSSDLTQCLLQGLPACKHLRPLFLEGLTCGENPATAPTFELPQLRSLAIVNSISTLST